MSFFFFKQKTAYEIGVRLVGSEMCIRDSLKSMDIYVNLSGGNNVSTNFVLETEELLDFVYQHIDRLNARLEKLGYNTHFEMKVAADSSDRLDFVKDFIEAEARPAAGGQYIFDAKA